MRNGRSFLYALFFVAAGSINAWAQGPLPECKEYQGLYSFQSAGGKLWVVRKPKLKTFWLGLPNACLGGAVFHFIVLKDGSVRWGGMDHNDMAQNGCDLALARRVEEARFSPPVLDRKPVCVGFSIGWDAGVPNSFQFRPESPW